MKDMGVIQGSAAQAIPLIVGKDTVYVHTDMKEIEGVDEFGKVIEGLYEYNEVQYNKDEFIQMLSESKSELQSLVDTQSEMLADVIGGVYA